MLIKKFFKRYGFSKLAIMTLDFLAFITGTTIAIKFTRNWQLDLFSKLNFNELYIFCVTIIISLFLFRYHNLYKQKIYFSKLAQFQLLIKNAVFSFLILLSLLFIFISSNLLSRARVFIFIIVSYSLIIIIRFFLAIILKKIFGNIDAYKRKVLIIGAGVTGKELLVRIKKDSSDNFNIIGFVDDNISLKGQKIDGIEVLGTVNELDILAAEYKIDEIFIAINMLEYHEILNLIEKCKGTDCQINIYSNHFGIIEKKTENVEMKDINYVPIYKNISNLYPYFFKRVFDMVVSIILLLVLSPFLLLIAFLVKVTSEGPVFYAPISIGRNGNPFKFYKFRSMYYKVSNDNHKKLVEEFISGKVVGAKLREDPRVTRIGKFIRKYSLDELAQLFNVVLGNMSLVGPRPCTPYEYDMMDDWHKRRFNALPGMTGLWQIAGRAEVSYTDMIMMDLYYIENCSFWLDIVILLKTFGVVIKGKGGF